MHRLADNLFNRCRIERIRNHTHRFRVRYKRSTWIPDAISPLLLALAFLALLPWFPRTFAVSTAATTATTATAAAFFTTLLLRTLRHWYCIHKVGLIQFNGFRCGR